MEMKKMNDINLSGLFKESPQKAYELVIDRYGNLVYAIVLNKLKGCAGREDIEDCVSDVFVKLMQTIENYSESKGDLKTYISTIAKRTAIDAFRRLSYRNNITSSMEENEIEIESNETPESETENKLSRKALWNAVKSLGEPDSTIIIRQFFYEQTAAEIGKLISMSAAAVQKRSERARKKLRELLNMQYPERRITE